MSLFSLFPKTRRETWAERMTRLKAESAELSERIAEERRLIRAGESAETLRGYRTVKLSLALCAPPAAVLGAFFPCPAVCAAIGAGVLSFWILTQRGTTKAAASAPGVSALTGAMCGAVFIRPLLLEVLYA
jgi:hypothetical protein